MTPVLAFDIETIPDLAGIRRLHGIANDTADADVAAVAFHWRRQTSGTDFLPLHLQRVVTIACALRERDSFRVWSLGGEGESEGEIISRFYDGIEKYTPQLVSWNGGGFDLPVLHYRGLIHGVRAHRYWDMGEDDREFKWNNYISRYHTRHLDMMDLLAMYQPRASVPLDDLAKLAGFPGKLGMDGSKVWEAYAAGQLQAICNYCETDAANTYLVFLRFQLMRGVFTEQQYRVERDLVKSTLSRSRATHWKEFLAQWDEAR